VRSRGGPARPGVRHVPLGARARARAPHQRAHAPEAVAPAYAAIDPCPGTRRRRATERERAYIEALATRYASDPPDDRSALDRAYADAMRDLSAAYPDDLDAATLFAEALMNLMPWDYWTADGTPRPRPSSSSTRSST
jgi:hypothetical protein